MNAINKLFRLLLIHHTAKSMVGPCTWIFRFRLPAVYQFFFLFLYFYGLIQCKYQQMQNWGQFAITPSSKVAFRWLKIIRKMIVHLLYLWMFLPNSENNICQNKITKVMARGNISKGNFWRVWWITRRDGNFNFEVFVILH